MAPTTFNSLTHRLVERYLTVGVACVFLCFTAGAILAWQGTYIEWNSAAVALPMLLLLSGAFVLRHSVGVHTAIEAQLRQVADVGASVETLRPIPSPETAALGWNALVSELRDRRAIVSLDAKLAGSFAQIEQERWVALFNSLSDGIAVCDANDIVLTANNALAAHLRRATAEELVGKRMSELLNHVTYTSDVVDAKLTREPHRSGVREILLGTDIADGVLRATRSGLADDASGRDAAVWCIEDVTQRKLAERMRTQFVATATHELRTPLTNIRAYSELLADEAGINLERQKEFCNVIGSEVSRLARFVDQMLNVSQMEAGGLTINRHETDLERLLAEVIEAVSPQAVQRELAFKVAVPAKLPKTRLDKDKFAAALVNLLGNAVKYTPAGSIGLTVEAATEQLAFHVDDSGIGIAPAELEKLGTRFFRSSDERVRAVNGSGLGLAFAQEVARLHGGRLTATSELNKGSRFSLVIPLR